MSVYVIGAIDREDMELYSQYEVQGFKTLELYGVEVLAASDAPSALEGQVPAGRIVLMRFKDQSSVDIWYNSPEYQQAVLLRRSSALTRFLFSFEGLDG